MKRGNARCTEGAGSGARRLIRCNMFTLHHLGPSPQPGPARAVSPLAARLGYLLARPGGAVPEEVKRLAGPHARKNTEVVL